MTESLYVHLPFCEKKCFYCSFAVVVAQQHNVDRYVSCLQKEMRAHQSTQLSSLYFGGGTPSLLSQAQLMQVTEMVYEYFCCPPGIEITMEVNPENADDERVRAIRRAGVNRISLGVQSWQPATLKFLGRVHDASRAAEACRLFRSGGFENINIDLMFGFPQQTRDDLDRDIDTLLAQESEHISLYGLTVEPSSRFFAVGLNGNAPEHDGVLYRHICERLDEAGYRQYEISNFARPGFESRHNRNYWDSGNYIGLGLSAHSHRDGRRSWNVDRFAEYLRRLEAGESPLAGEEILTPRQRFNEALVFGLRCNDGVGLPELAERFGQAVTAQQQAKLEEFCQQGLLVQTKDRIQTTLEGRLVLDAIAAFLI